LLRSAEAADPFRRRGRLGLADLRGNRQGGSFVERHYRIRRLGHDRNVAKVTMVEVPDRPGVAHSVFAALTEAGVNVDTIIQNVGHHRTTDLSFTIRRGDLAEAKRILEPIVHELGFREITTDSTMARVSIAGAGIKSTPGYASRMFGALAEAGVNIEMISTSETQITCVIEEYDLETALKAIQKAFDIADSGSEAAARPAR
jgi:aspartate kinase